MGWMPKLLIHCIIELVDNKQSLMCYRHVLVHTSYYTVSESEAVAIQKMIHLNKENRHPFIQTLNPTQAVVDNLNDTNTSQNHKTLME